MRRLLLVFALNFVFCASELKAEAEAHQIYTSLDSAPIVVELFTSQGCSSCPKADALLTELASKPDVIAIACHVTYWNYLGWRDTFSNSFCDKRQARFKNQFNLSSAYTPQMVINGVAEVVGTQKSKVLKLVAENKQTSALARLPLQIKEQTIEVSLTELAAYLPLQVLLLGVGSEQVQKINRGENGGKTIRYSNPVLKVLDLGAINKAESIQQSLQNTPAEIHKWVAIVQSLHSQYIIAAASIDI